MVIMVMSIITLTNVVTVSTSIITMSMETSAAACS